MSFHVPNYLRDRIHAVLASDDDAGNNGAFRVTSPEPGWYLAIIASDGDGWEHVSVHAYRPRPKPDGRERGMRVPSWKEMCFVKDLFWDAEDEVVQFHPPRSQYVNCHPHTLHLWRPNDGSVIPSPPPSLVGPKGDA